MGRREEGKVGRVGEVQTKFNVNTQASSSTPGTSGLTSKLNVGIDTSTLSKCDRL